MMVHNIKKSDLIVLLAITRSKLVYRTALNCTPNFRHYFVNNHTMMPASHYAAKRTL
jgi:hypothetical protein